jgi:hypothetical protein
MLSVVIVVVIVPVGDLTPAWMPRYPGARKDTIVTRLLTLVAATLGAMALLVTSGVPSAAAHERRTMAGKYTFVVGFINEPALVEEPNGIDLRITNVQTNEPVEGAEKTLKADVAVGGQTKTFELRARFGQKGAYTADLFPTKTGTWTFHFYGTLEGTAVDEKFESGPGRFNDVQAKTDLQFPAKQPSIGELAQQVQQAGQPTEAAMQPAHSHMSSADVQRALDRANSARSTAITFGLFGSIVGLVGVTLAAYALMSRRAGARREEPV